MGSDQQFSESEPDAGCQLMELPIELEKQFGLGGALSVASLDFVYTSALSQPNLGVDDFCCESTSYLERDPALCQSHFSGDPSTLPKRIVLTGYERSLA